MSEISEISTPSEAGVVSSEIIPSDLQQEYESNKGEIERFYKEAGYWHGTGRKQYKDGQVVDVLEKIVNEGGLMPQRDPFDTKSGAGQTISLSDRRMYSAGYAQMHIAEGQHLRYQYKSSEFWGIFLHNTIKSAMGNSRLETTIKAAKILWSHIKERKNPTYLFKIASSARSWASKVTHKPYEEPMSKVFTVRSDIPGNYPILIGIKDGVFIPVQTAEFISLYEVRSTESLPLSSLTHLEVPQAYLKETQDFLNQRKVVNLPVIAMELGEVHSSQFSTQQLLEGNPFRK